MTDVMERPGTSARDRGRARVFSGHESFAVRYGWLPKVYEAVMHDPEIFVDDERAILMLGLGKNMVRSIRFWGDAFGVTRTEGRVVRPTGFGRRLLDPDLGADPFLEDIGSLWRLHWQITVHGGLGAWTAAFLSVTDAEVARRRLLELITASSMETRGGVNAGTAAAHLDMLIKTYDASADRSAAVLEDTLGSPFQELDLLRTATPGGVPTIRLNRGCKGGLDWRTLAFALADHWRGTAPGSSALTMRSIMLDRVSPGSVYRLDEATMHGLLERICDHSDRLALRGDGIGGLELVSTKAEGPEELERLAW
ncbi:DUF4007 family protein [Glacieibacterium frigidum]|uniref:DUF4007 family protein n=1 Tax=Glacieibacterium frigidum TaxID=2593303 RepID=A0A552U8I4_9SPHN|nr:DUF4007 family protein [Glacieibacterium frigidum]TRW14499.1 DUF4007 family protein [Glacieibacterium frigidum]